MPGMFGGIDCGAAQYEALTHEFRSIWDRCETTIRKDVLLGAHAHDGAACYSVDKFWFAVDGERSIYRNAASFVRTGRLPLYEFKSGRMKPTSYCKGNIALFAEDSNELILATEPTGSFPLYYTLTDSGLLFCSHIRPLAKLICAKRDDVGVVELMRYGYTYFGRTCFEGIKRLQPGQSLCYQRLNGKLEIYETSTFWTHVRTQDVDVDQAAEEAWAMIMGAAKRSWENKDLLNGVMTSAGWDSRVLLHAAREQIGKSRIICYSHGDIASRELSIVSRMTGASGIECHMEPLSDSHYDPDSLRHWFARVENVMFPYWHKAGEWLTTFGARNIAAGIFGEVLGGHYGKEMLLGNAAKIGFVLSRLLEPRKKGNGGRDQDISAVYDFMTLDRFDRPWYLDKEYWASLGAIKDQVNADIEATLNRIRTRGVCTGDQFVEAFITETRATQYIAAQLLSCRGSTDITNVFADREFMQFASELPLALKIHNRLSRATMARFGGKDLLKFPTAAIMVPAAAPILLQEITRILRKTCKGLSTRLQFASKGRLKAKCLGWDNLEFLRNGITLDQISESIRSDFVNKARLKEFIRQIRNQQWKGQLHDASNQFMKIYTVDLTLQETLKQH